MMKIKERKPQINDSGFVTADFIFSFLLASMLTSLLFAMCFSFTVIEIAQYISFSSTRAALPGHKNFEEQKKRAENKLNVLMANPVLAPLLRNGWFELRMLDMKLGENSSDYYASEYTMNPIRGIFYVPPAGVRLSLKAKILNMNMGPLGKLESESGDGFNLTISSLLFRDPSQDECQQIIQNRYSQLLSKEPSTYGSIGSANANFYVPMEDNGC